MSNREKRLRNFLSWQCHVQFKDMSVEWNNACLAWNLTTEGSKACKSSHYTCRVCCDRFWVWFQNFARNISKWFNRRKVFEDGVNYVWWIRVRNSLPKLRNGMDMYPCKVKVVTVSKHVSCFVCTSHVRHHCWSFGNLNLVKRLENPGKINVFFRTVYAHFQSAAWSTSSA